MSRHLRPALARFAALAALALAFVGVPRVAPAQCAV